MSYRAVGELHSVACLKREKTNPVVAPKDVPYRCSLAFNAGVTKFNGKYVMVFRNDIFDHEGTDQYKSVGVNLGLAYSDDGINWQVEAKPCLSGEWLKEHRIIRIYDPRLTVIDGRCCMCFAVDSYHGVRGGIAVTDDFQNFELMHLTVPENRNMVLFPEKIGGKYVRLERPFPMYGRGREAWESTRFDIWSSCSPDLRYWGDTKLVMGVEHVPFANDKIGPAAPPVKTPKGWLTTFHAVDIDNSRGKNGWEPRWTKRYNAGIMLLDLENPRKVIGMCQTPLIAPEADYELTGGFRDNVIFPGGMILEPDGEVKIYYGAGDAVECLATAHVDELLAACKPVDWDLSK